jgi:hypothetical protein
MLNMEVMSIYWHVYTPKLLNKVSIKSGIGGRQDDISESREFHFGPYLSTKTPALHESRLNFSIFLKKKKGRCTNTSED